MVASRECLLERYAILAGTTSGFQLLDGLVGGEALRRTGRDPA